MNSISIITVNYNQPQATEELLESIIQMNTYPLLEVIIIDNGSSENMVPHWTRKYPNFRFIRLENNLGFAGGNNVGITESTGEYLFLLNNDTVITEMLVEKLAEFLNHHPDYAMVSPKIHYYTPRTMLQYVGFTKMNFYTGRNKCIGQFETDSGQYENLGQLTYYAHGAAMMLRKSLVKDVGMMPENYFLYYEEMDWCEMFKRAGYKIGLCIDALVYHKESLSTGKNSPLKSYYMSRNRLLFVRRNANTLQRLVFFIYYATVVHSFYVLSCIKNGHSHQLFLFAKAFIWNLRNNSHVSVLKK